jgi:GPI mannosyltransferase 2
MLFVVLNRILFALTAYEIQRILTLICEGKDKRMVEIGTIAFLFNPASIFYHTLYTESIFCFITCKSIRMALEAKHQWLTAILLSFGVALRSNGMFLAPVIGL